MESLLVVKNRHEMLIISLPIPLLFVALYIIHSRFMPTKQRYARAPIACINLRDPNQTLAKARQRFCTDAVSMLQEGYKKYRGKPWYVPSPLGERLMIPSKYVEELKAAPVDEVDFVATFFEMFEGHYTTMGSRSTLHPRVARVQLNQNMGSVLAPVASEIKEAFEMHLPSTEEWQAVNIADAMVNIVAQVSSRMFGGTQLSRHSEWVDATIKFARDGFIGAQAIKQYPRIVRPFAAKFIPALKKINEYHKNARSVIVPILEAREAAEALGCPESGGKPPMDFLQWMLESSVGEEKDKAFIASILLKLSFAAIHTSAAAPTQLLYDLCAAPGYIQPLRDEIAKERAESNGILDKAALARLEKLDSIMKESQRFNPLLLVTFERLVTRPYTLSDGFQIPAGTQIGVPTQAISMDPDLYPDPTKFDGFRFVKMKQALTTKDPSAMGRLSFASSNHEGMTFGYGRHACPGRWFAANEIKMIMSYLLENYDFRYPGGKTGWENRPKSVNAETQFLPNHEALIEFRLRKGV